MKLQQRQLHAPTTLTEKTAYCLNTAAPLASTANIQNRGDLANTILGAVCAYL